MDVVVPAPHAPRLWTLPEANAALPRVRALLAEAKSVLAGLREAEEQLEDLHIVWDGHEQSPACPGHGEFARYDSDRRALRNDLETVVLKFQQLGCELKDLEQGLVDFRGQVGRQTVYLCWRDGEDAVRHFHPLQAGFAGRKPIPGLL